MGVKEWIGKRKEEFKEHQEKKRVEQAEYNKAYDEAYKKGRLVRARREGFKRGRQTGGGFLGGFQPFMETMGRAGRNFGNSGFSNPGFGGFASGRRSHRIHHKKTRSQPQVIIIGGRQPSRRRSRPSKVVYY